MTVSCLHYTVMNLQGPPASQLRGTWARAAPEDPGGDADCDDAPATSQRPPLDTVNGPGTVADRAR